MTDQLQAQPVALASSSDLAQPSTAAFAQQHREEAEGDWQNHINVKCQGDLSGSSENYTESNTSQWW